MTTDEHLRKRFVGPFYLKMMSVNAAYYDFDLADRVAKVGTRASEDDVVQLLGLAWRERVMGAWLALFHDSTVVTTAVLTALETSRGHLDSPPLATAAVLLAGVDSLESLVTYHEADKAAGWGAADIAEAAADYLHERYGMENPLPAPSAEARETFEEMLAGAERIRSKVDGRRPKVSRRAPRRSPRGR